MSTAAVLTVLLWSSTGFSPTSENLLTNPSFEQKLADWELASQLQVVEAGARTGRYCVMGDGSGLSKQYLNARKKVTLEAGSVYRLSLWVRSDNGSCVSVNLARSGRRTGGIGRLNVTPKKWTKATFVFAVEKAGEYAIDFILPNTWVPKAGRGWMDDVSLVKLGSCRPEEIGSGLYDDYPTAKADSNGNVWMACLAFDTQSKSEQIVLRRYDEDGWSKPRTVVSGAEMFAPALAVNDTAQWVAWSQRTDGNWDVFARRVGSKMGPIIRVTRSAAVDRNVSATVTDGGDVWVAWQSDRTGNNDIFAAVVNRGPIKPAAISTFEGSDYNPAVLAVGKTVFVAWDSFREGSYDVYLKAIGAGRPGELLQITDAATTENRPTLTADDSGRLWIAYNVGSLLRGHYGRRNHKFFGLRCLDRGKLFEPVAKAAGVWDTRDEGEEFPAVAFSAAGGMRVATAVTMRNLRCWMLAGRTLSGEKWTSPRVVSGAAYTTCRRPALVSLPDGRAVLIWARTDRINSHLRRSNRLGKSTICATMLGALPKENTRPPQLKPVALRRPDVPAVAERTHRVIEYGGEKLKAFWGDLHSHSTISICVNHADARPDSLYAYTRDNAALDFMALTDHGGHMNAPDFHVVRKLARANHQPHRFVAFLAQEWSSAGDGGFGHKNIIYAHDEAERYYNPHAASIQPKPFGHATPTELWNALREKDALTIPHQLADAQHRAYTDWSFKDKWMQPVAEILQSRGSYEFKNAPLASKRFAEGHSLHDAWAAGHVLGVIASPDHGGSRGRAVVFSVELTRRAIHDALRSRRCYGTTGARIFLDVRLEGRNPTTGTIELAWSSPVWVSLEGHPAKPQ